MLSPQLSYNTYLFLSLRAQTTSEGKTAEEPQNLDSHISIVNSKN